MPTGLPSARTLDGQVGADLLAFRLHARTPLIRGIVCTTRRPWTTWVWGQGPGRVTPTGSTVSPRHEAPTTRRTSAWQQSGTLLMGAFQVPADSMHLCCMLFRAIPHACPQPRLFPPLPLNPLELTVAPLAFEDFRPHVRRPNRSCTRQYH